MPYGLRILSPLRLPFRQAGAGAAAPLSIAFRAGPIPRPLPVGPISGLPGTMSAPGGTMGLNRLVTNHRLPQARPIAGEGPMKPRRFAMPCGCPAANRLSS